jgi:ankyrin repeat protein
MAACSRLWNEEDRAVKFSHWSRVVLAAAGGALLVSSPAMAQFSKSWKFLEAVRNKDGQEVSDDLGDPSTNLINTHDSTSGQTALHIVTARRDLTWMEFLIAKGAEVDARDIHGETPLVMATNLGFVEGVQLLVAHGAKVDEPSSTGETPLIAAVHRHDLALMRVLLAGGANADRTDNSGRSARDYAMLLGKDNAVETLIESQAKTPGTHSPTSYGPHL